MTFTAGVPNTEFFSELGYNTTESAVIAPNFQGLGLPSYLWY